MTDTSARTAVDGGDREFRAPDARGGQDRRAGRDAGKENADYKDKLLRTLAEMENLRRRTEREVADSRVYGIAIFARDILAVADNMARGACGARRRTARDTRTPASRRCSTASN